MRLFNSCKNGNFILLWEKWETLDPTPRNPWIQFPGMNPWMITADDLPHHEVQQPHKNGKLQHTNPSRNPQKNWNPWIQFPGTHGSNPRNQFPITQVADDLLHHEVQHAAAVLGVQEGQELLLAQQQVRGRIVRLVPAILQVVQHFLRCRERHFGIWDGGFQSAPLIPNTGMAPVQFLGFGTIPL